MADDPENEMPPSIKQANDLIVEAHEERIQRLEQVSQDTSSRVAAMEERIDSGFKYLGEKIETCIAPIADRLSSHMDDDEKTNSQTIEAIKALGGNESRLVKLEDNAEKRRNRWATLKKGVWAIGIAIVGAAAKALFDHLK